MSRKLRMNFAVVVGLVMTAVLVVSACGGSDPTAAPRKAAPAATKAAPAATMAPAATKAPAAAPKATAYPKSTAAPKATAAPKPTAAPTAAPSGPQPVRGGTLVARDLFDWPNWDTGTAYGAFTVHMMMQALNNLMYFDAFEGVNNIVPELATSWEITDGGTTTTFHLREGVTWADGAQFTAADVVWNMNRQRNSAPPVTSQKGKFLGVTSITASDPLTVVVKHENASASFLPNMATPPILMYPPQGENPTSAEWKSAAFGTGAFILDDYQKNTEYTFVANPNYWKKDAEGRALPYLDAIQYLIIGNPDTALAAFRAGRLDCGCFYDNNFLTVAKEDLEKEFPDVILETHQAGRLWMLFNNRGVFQDVNVRKGFLASLDLLTVAQTWRKGDGFYPPTLFHARELGGKWSLPADEILAAPGFRLKDGVRDPADLELAAQLFAEAGVDASEISATMIGSTFYTDVYTAVDAVTKAAGLGSVLALVPFGQLFTVAGTGDWDIFQDAGFQFDDPSDKLPPFVVSDGSSNFGNWNFPEVDALYTKVEGSVDPAQRLAAAEDFQRMVMFEKAIVWPIAYEVKVWGTHGNVVSRISGRELADQHQAGSVNSRVKLEDAWKKKD